MKAEDIVLLDNEPTLVAFTSEEDIIAGSGWDKGKLVVNVANFNGKLAQQLADGVSPTDAVNKQQLDLKADKNDYYTKAEIDAKNKVITDLIGDLNQVPDLTPLTFKGDK